MSKTTRATRTPDRSGYRVVRVVLLGTAATLSSCAAPSDGRERTSLDPGQSSEGVAIGRETTGTIVDARPAALLQGDSILWGDLRPSMAEAAGAVALQELILDRRLDELAEREGLTIGSDEILAERRLLLETLDPDPDTAHRLLETLRNQQRLGPARFSALLRRNAILRRLVAPDVVITQEAVHRLYDTRYGARRQARLITTTDLGSAQSAVRRARQGTYFGEVAVQVSTDASAPRGGLLAPMSALDPSYPDALRAAVWGLAREGDVSDPVAIDGGYAVVQLVSEQPAQDVALEDVQEEVAKLARVSQERVLMDRLSRRLIADARPTIFDPSLKDAWDRR